MPDPTVYPTSCASAQLRLSLEGVAYSLGSPEGMPCKSQDGECSPGGTPPGYCLLLNSSSYPLEVLPQPQALPSQATVSLKECFRPGQALTVRELGERIPASLLVLGVVLDRVVVRNAPRAVLCNLH